MKHNRQSSPFQGGQGDVSYQESIDSDYSVLDLQPQYQIHFLTESTPVESIILNDFIFLFTHVHNGFFIKNE
jgi:hypothetical protein